VRVPAIWNDRMRAHARIYYAAEQLGKLDEVHSEIFNEIHQRNNPLATMESAAAFFTAHGVAQDAFQKAYLSFAVESNLKRALTLNELYRIDSVPTLVINGKYVTDVGRAGGQKQLIALINELAAREHGT
jgi:thiol:disulfide interchange protein DsbA